MAFSLSAEAEARHYRLQFYEKVESTNLLAAEFAANGDRGCLWIAAAEQTGGRGRRGRIWQSPKGNLYASLLLAEDFSAESAAQLGFAAGLALAEALAALLPPAFSRAHNIALKWPNDVLADGAKLAGILVDYIPPRLGGKQAERRAAIIIGFGVNAAAAPEIQAQAGAAAYSAISLRQMGADISAASLLRALSFSWLANYHLWNKGRGMSAVRDKWLRHAAYIGKPIHLRLGGRIVSGLFETINEKGQLVLAKADGEKLFVSAGDVYFGAAASADAGR